MPNRTISEHSWQLFFAGLRAIHSGVAVGLMTLACASFAQPVPETRAANVVHDRVAAEYDIGRNADQAKGFIASQQADGRWADINYADKGRSIWKPLQHLDRLLSISLSCKALVPAASERPACRETLERGVRRWVSDPPESDNWWNNSIGAPLKLARILVLAGDYLEPQTSKAAAALLDDGRSTLSMSATGQNLMWFAELQLVRGVVERTPALIAAAAKRVQSTLDIGQGEGWQADFSFHQHGSQLYNGGYGLLLVSDVTRVAGWLQDTPWALEPAKTAFLADAVLDGTRWMTAGPCWIDYSSRGREFTRQGSGCAPSPLAPAARRLAQLAPARATELEAFAQSQSSADAPGRFAPFGVRAFWRSDYIVQRSAGGYASVKVASQRTVGTESMNGENLAGFWMPFGTTWFASEQKLPPVPALMDWSRLPGVTAGDEVPAIQGKVQPGNRFGGVLSDQGLGLAAFQQDAAGITAKKSWFMVGDAVIALGAGIRGGKGPVHTAIDQAQLQTKVVLDDGVVTEPGRDIQGKSLLWHADVGYVLMEPARVRITIDKRTRQRKSINTAVRDETFTGSMLTLSIQHEAKGAGYAYAVLPGATVEQVRRWQASGAWRIAANSEIVQAVVDGRQDHVLAVFHRAGQLIISDDLALRVGGPVLLSLSRTDGNRWEVSAADPLHAANQVRLELHSGRKSLSRIITFARGADAGRASPRQRLS